MVSIEAGVSASSNDLTVEWFLNGLRLDIATDPHLSQTVENSMYTLTITDISSQRLGEYTVVITIGSGGPSDSDGVNVSYSGKCSKCIFVRPICSPTNTYIMYSIFSLGKCLCYILANLLHYVLIRFCINCIVHRSAPPTVSVPTSQLTVNESAELRVHCQANRVGVVTVQWLFNGNDLPSGVTQNETDLYISSATRTHTGEYECRGSNIAGTVSKTVNIAVYCEY